MDTLNRIIADLEQKLVNGSKEEKESLNNKIYTLRNCSIALSNEDDLLNYDFEDVFNILREYNIEVEEISKYVSEIKDVIGMKKALNMPEFAYSKEQVSALEELNDRLNNLFTELNEKMNSIKVSEESIESVTSLKELKNIFEGNGRKKYFTKDMTDALFENLDYESLSDEEFNNLTEMFFKTRNFQVSQGLNKEDLEEVIALFKEFFSEKEFDTTKAETGELLKLVRAYSDEITSRIDLFDARKILEFFKEKGVLDRFEKKAILKIVLYGSPHIVKEFYERKEKEGYLKNDAYFTSELAFTWTNESITRRRPFRVTRKNSQDKEEKEHSLYSELQGPSDEEFLMNIEILKKNQDLFDETIDLDDFDRHLRTKVKTINKKSSFETLRELLLHSSWSLFKNNSLFRLLDLSNLYKIPVSALNNGDLENKLHLAIELGLLNPPMDLIYRHYDKDFDLNQKFLGLKSQKGIFNNTIRNYFARNMTILSTLDISTFGFLMNKLYDLGPQGFYNYFFSESLTGYRDKTGIDKDIELNMPNKDEFIYSHFIINDVIIPNYDMYDYEISEYNEQNKKNDNYENPEQESIEIGKKPYFDKSILEDELIQVLEKNYRVMNQLTSNEEMITCVSPYLYNINGRLYSRYRILRNASILEGIHGSLDMDMLLTSICRNTFVNEKEFNDLKTLLEERNMKK